VRTLIFLSGLLIAAAGIVAFRQTNDPSLLQGGLTLGGGFVICGIFSIKAKWHGIVGATMLAFLGGLRALPGMMDEQGPGQIFKGVAGTLCLVVLIAAVKTLLSERTRRSIEKLKAE
jgi:hypothetical protein